MQNPRFFLRIDGKVPYGYSMLGYAIPFNYDDVTKLISDFSGNKEWKTIQIKIIPSLIADKTKILIISTEIKHVEVPSEHLVMLLDDRTKNLIASSGTLQELFDLVNERLEPINHD